MTPRLLFLAALTLAACSAEDRRVDVTETGGSGGAGAGAGAGGAGACGGVGAFGPEEAKAALVGTWRSTDIGQFAKVLISLDQFQTFSGDGSQVSTGTATFKPSLPLYAGCLEATTVHGTFTVTGAPGSLVLGNNYTDGITTRSACANSADNAQNLPLTPSELAINNSTGGPIVLSEGSFTLTNTVNAEAATYTFVKQ